MIERHGQDLPIASRRHHVAEAAWVNVPDVLRCGLSDLNADGSDSLVSPGTVFRGGSYPGKLTFQLARFSGGRSV